MTAVIFSKTLVLGPCIFLAVKPTVIGSQQSIKTVRASFLGKVFNCSDLPGRKPFGFIVEISACRSVINLQFFFVVVKSVLNFHVRNGVMGGLTEEKGRTINYGHEDKFDCLW